MIPARAILLAASALLAATGAGAGVDKDPDLDLIPQAVRDAKHDDADGDARDFKLFVEDAADFSDLRSDLVVPFPGRFAAPVKNRTSADYRQSFQLLPGLTLDASDRFSVIADSDTPWTPADGLRNDLRELFATWTPADGAFFELGRVNLRNGIAQGFNPTDFFKVGSAVDIASIDPSDRRLDRLGSAVARVERIWDGGAISLTVSPKLGTPDFAAKYHPLDPRFNETNGENRALISASWDVAGLSPQALLLIAEGRTIAGLDLSYLVAPSVLVYGEWAGGRQQDLVGAALHAAQPLGLPFATDLPSFRASRRFDNDLSIGGTWSDAQLEAIATLEYHYHDAGLSSDEWHALLGADTPAAIQQSWFIRGYAADTEQPLGRHEIFTRLSFDDVAVLNLTLSMLAIADLRDGSVTAQASGSYPLSSRWSISAYLAATDGSRRSDFGSTPVAFTASLVLDRYL